MKKKNHRTVKSEKSRPLSGGRKGAMRLLERN